MTSLFMLIALVEQANLWLKSEKKFKTVTINTATRVVSDRFNLAVTVTYVFNHLRYVRKIWLIITRSRI